jgi:hypothetical protein
MLSQFRLIVYTLGREKAEHWLVEAMCMFMSGLSLGRHGE